MIHNRLPLWFRQGILDQPAVERRQQLLALKVNTVCQEAKCPNLNSCFKEGKLTFMILGKTCTRNCRFCGVEKLNNKGLGLDLAEPLRIAEAVKKLGLNYVVITSVTRDDLADGGATIFAQTIKLIQGINRNIKIEVLIPDFKGNTLSIKRVLDAKPSMVAHNIETVRRLHKELRPKADYKLSLDVLNNLKALSPKSITKSSLILGLGEREEEVIQTMQDLRQTLCDILTLGQYLAPSSQHYPVREFITLAQFQRYQEIGLSLGFKSVLSGPLVRSSYQAERVYKEFVYV